MKKLSKPNERRMLAKIQPWREYTQCVGYLTPTEIVHLVGMGCRPESTWKVEEAKRQIKAGENYGTWFYFHPTKELLAILRERFPQYQKHGALKCTPDACNVP